jgi:hypothetical protein
MPIPYTTTPVTTPKLPINNLEEFVEESQALFDNIVGPWNQILFEEEDRKPLVDAWNDLRPHVPTIQVRVGQVDPTFTNAGLVGPQLDSKLQSLTNAWKKFVAGGTVKLLKNLLGWINLILGSIAALFPPTTVAAEALKEFKEVIDKLINKAEA